MAGKIAAATGAVVALKKSYDLLAENLRSGMELQTSMAEVYTLIDVTEQQFRALTDSVLELSKDVPESAKGLANALYEVVSAGVDVGNSMQFLELSAKAGVAGVTQTKIAVDALTTIMNAYGMSSNQAEEISDKLFTTVRLGKTRFELLASTLGMVVPVASAYNVAFEQIAAAYATMTKNGVKTEQTSTSLAAAITEIVTPGNKVAEALKKMGYESGEAALKQKTLQSIAADLYNAGFNLAEIFGREASRAILLLGKNAKTASDDLESMAVSAGATEKAYEKMGNTLSVNNEILKNNLQFLGEELNKRIIPALTSAAELATEFLRQLTETDLDKSIRKLKEYGAAAESIAIINAYNELIKAGKELAKIEKQFEKAGKNFEFSETFKAMTSDERLQAVKKQTENITQNYIYLAEKELDYEQQKDGLQSIEKTRAIKDINELKRKIDSQECFLSIMQEIVELDSRSAGEKERQTLAQTVLNKLKNDEKDIVDGITEKENNRPGPLEKITAEIELTTAELHRQQQIEAQINRILFARKEPLEQIKQLEQEIATLESLGEEISREDYLLLLQKQDSLVNIQNYYNRIAETQGKIDGKQKDILDTGRFLADTFAQATFNAKNMGDVLEDSAKRFAQQIASDMFYYLLWMAVTGGQGAFTGGPAFSLLGKTLKLPGFAQGGSFTIPGAGAPDSKVVMFKGSPGEQVTVTTPGQQMDSAVVERLDRILGLIERGGNLKLAGNDFEVFLNKLEKSKL
jgi:TP901 family phage tail tape measure protein